MKASEINKIKENYIGELEIENSTETIPITVLRSLVAGPTVLLSAGLHCAEYNGIEALIQLSKTLPRQLIKGRVIILPLICKNGFEHRTMSLIYEDNKNLNRIFPGNINGTLADKIAYTLSTYILPHVDYHIDIHSGDGYEELIPLVFFAGGFDDQSINQKSYNLCQYLDVQYAVKSTSTTGGFYQTSLSLGASSVLLERGGMGHWSHEEINQDLDDIYRILSVLEMVPQHLAKPKTQSQILIDEAYYIRSPKTGCWLPSYNAGDTFNENDILGIITDYFGNTVNTVYAKCNGVVLYQTKSLCTIEKGALIAYGKLS